ncbi:MAG: IPT/TIG domain-containing protein, partial [Planctomycetota bacterium]
MLNLFSRTGLITTLLSLAMLAAAGCKKSSSSSPPPPPAGPGPVSITSLAPTTGDIAGGTAFTITGTGFLTGATVTFGGTSATVTSVSGVQIIGSTPSTATPGAVTVVVTNPDTGAATLTNGFIYTSGAAPAPQVTSIVPTYGPTGGSTTITVTGSGFQTGLTVTVGGAAATNIVVTSATTMTFDTPTGTTGSATIVITNPDTQSVTVTNGFSYGTPAPTVTSITPTSGPTAGGTTVTINGTGFQNSGTAQATVSIGGVACTNVQVLTAATIVCDTGAATVVGPQNVVVTNPDTQSGTLTNGYTYVGPNPTVTGISPTVGSQSGGTT